MTPPVDPGGSAAELRALGLLTLRELEAWKTYALALERCLGGQRMEAALAARLDAPALPPPPHLDEAVVAVVELLKLGVDLEAARRAARAADRSARTQPVDVEPSRRAP